jgi:ABC-type lipoprotein release transport system permease subunit
VGLELRLAWRNVWRNPFRTALTIAATVFAVVLTVLVVALNTGTHEKMIEDSVRLGSGHLQVYGPGYLEKRTLEHYLEYDEDLVDTIASEPGVEGFAGRVVSFGLLSRDDATFGVMVMGVEPEREAGVTTLVERVSEGRFVAESGAREIVLGERLARNLSAEVGDVLLLFSSAYSLETAYDLFTVVGVMRLPDAHLERTLALIDLHDAQEFFVYGSRVSEVAIRTRDSDAGPMVAAGLRARLDPERTDVYTWQETSPEMEQLVLLDDAGMYITLAILVVVVGFGILNTILMAVLERKREFGVALALGLPPAAIFRVVYFESLFLAGVGLLLGLAISVPIASVMEGYPISLTGGATEALQLFGVEPQIVWKLHASNPIGSALTIFCVALLAALYPAVKASQARPVDALRSL